MPQGEQLPLAGHLHRHRHLCLPLRRSLRQSQRLSCARLVSLFPGLQTEREASASLAGSEGASYGLTPPGGAGGLIIAGVKSGQVEQRKLSVSCAMVVAGQWFMPTVARQSSHRGSGKLN